MQAETSRMVFLKSKAELQSGYCESQAHMCTSTQFYGLHIVSFCHEGNSIASRKAKAFFFFFYYHYLKASSLAHIVLT